MAVTGPRRPLSSRTFIVPLFLTSLLWADRQSDVRGTVNQVANALAAGSASDAISAFDKSCRDYDTVRQYFQGLADSFDVTNQIEIADEQDTDTETVLKVDWDLTITDRTSDSTEHRQGEITVKLKAIDGKWKIIAFAPFDIFNPAIRNGGKH